MDDKVKKILELQEKGTPRKEIAEALGYKRADSLTRFMKNKDFTLVDELFIKEDNENKVMSLVPEEPVETSKDDECNINIINEEEAPEDMINIIPEGFKDNMINLVNQYDKLQEVINWFNSKDDIDNTNVIEVNTGIKIDLPEAPIKRTTIRVNEKVWSDFISLADANSEFDKHSLLSMAIKEYTEKYNK